MNLKEARLKIEIHEDAHKQNKAQILDVYSLGLAKGYIEGVEKAEKIFKLHVLKMMWECCHLKNHEQVVRDGLAKTKEMMSQWEKEK